jgi:hypothetical protein
LGGKRLDIAVSGVAGYVVLSDELLAHDPADEGAAATTAAADDQ